MEPGEFYWKFIEPICDAVSIYDGHDLFIKQFSAIRPEQGHLLAAHWCLSEVINGGFLQFFCNSTGILAPEAIIAFRQLGLGECANVIEQAMAIFGTPYPRDKEKRREILGIQDDDLPTESPLDELDDLFYDLLPFEDSRFEIIADEYAKRFEV